MKIVGILLVGLVAGMLAAAFSLATGGTLWAALVTYVAAGMVATVLGLGVVIWRVWVFEHDDDTDLILSGAHPASK